MLDSDHFDLLVDHLPGKPVDRDVHPVVLLALHDKLFRIRFSRRLATRLRNDVHYRIPRACLRYRWDCVCGRGLQATRTASIGEHLRLHGTFVLNYHLLRLDRPVRRPVRLDEYLIYFRHSGQDISVFIQ
jgi:hypothetical protein